MRRRGAIARHERERAKLHREIERLRGRGDVEELTRVLASDNPATESVAAAALAELGEQVVDPLVRTVLTDEFATWRRAAVDVLKRVGTGRAADLLTREFRGGNPTTRRIALEVLAELDEARARDLLIASLDDEDDLVREVATQRLGLSDDPSAVEALVGALSDRSIEVRILAAEGLGALGDPVALGPLLQMIAGTEAATLHPSDRDRITSAAIAAVLSLGGGRSTPGLASLGLSAVVGWATEREASCDICGRPSSPWTVAIPDEEFRAVAQNYDPFTRRRLRGAQVLSLRGRSSREASAMFSYLAREAQAPPMREIILGGIEPGSDPWWARIADYLLHEPNRPEPARRGTATSLASAWWVDLRREWEDRQDSGQQWGGWTICLACGVDVARFVSEKAS